MFHPHESDTNGLSSLTTSVRKLKTHKQTKKFEELYTAMKIYNTEHQC